MINKVLDDDGEDGSIVLKMILIHLLGIISVLKDVMSSGLKLLEIFSYAKTSDKQIRTRGKLKNYYSMTALQVLFILYIYIHTYACVCMCAHKHLVIYMFIHIKCMHTVSYH